MLKKLLATVVASMVLVVAPLGLAQPPGQPTYTVQFNDSDILEVIKFVAEVTGKTMVIDPRVKGRIKIMSNKALTEEELFNLFRSVLEISDFTVVEVGDIVRIVPLKDARTAPTSVNKEKGGDDSEFVTQVIQLNNIAAAKVIPVLRPLVPQNSHLAAYDPSNAIVITDTVANIARMRAVIDKIDKAASPITEIVKLKFADAEAVISILEKLEGEQNRQQGQGPQSNSVSMVADTRNNAILLTGEDVKRGKIRQLIRQLDQPQSQTGNVRVVYLEYAEAKEVAAVLTKVVQNMQKMDSGGKPKGSPKADATVEADEATNALLITANKEVLDSLLAVVARLDIRRAQVLVEAIIVDINVSDGSELGVEWLFANQDAGVFGGSSRGSETSLGIAASLLNTTDQTAGLTGLATGIAGNRGQTLGVAGDGREAFTAILTALRGNSKANILSTPSLLTMDNQEATISVGQNVPFRTGSFTSTGGGSTNPTNPFTTIQRENVGISLTVTPQVNEGNKVLLSISQEVSSLSDGVAGSADLITNESTITTQILANDGQTVVLGGLIREDIQDSQQKVPVLGSIPIIGNLFKFQSTDYKKANLMVFLRAKIIRDDETLYGATAEKYRAIQSEQELIRAKGLQMLSNDYIPNLPELEPMKIEQAPAGALKSNPKVIDLTGDEE